MPKKNLKEAANGALSGMRQTQAQKILQQSKESTTAKNDKPFTVWTTEDNVRRWKAYQKARKATFPTQAAFIEAALLEYIRNHPVTDAEKAELIKDLDL